MSKRNKKRPALTYATLLNPLEEYIGRKLKTVRDLEPGGFVVNAFGSEWLSAKCENEFIPKGAWVKVIKYDYQQQKLVVRRL